MANLHNLNLDFAVDNATLALRPKPFTLREALPGYKICILRCYHLSILSSCMSHTLSIHRHESTERGPGAAISSSRILFQRKDELGQQQPGMYSGISTMAKTRIRSDPYGCELRT